ncbi:hypothetical protein MKP08_07545 [Erythrobacter sp. LQ02-29]|uniref:hypothetical protein n=1 Tax=Erythrobacter sp. LQ02-29 TaxID=2920384 RepID=UPI001F4EB69B|nr:hypothetical protein [Erythrobacter sp. LQ02-29]MCP9222596.1 hypothetical protein [Erythrobacter sp. LQ02-29]
MATAKSKPRIKKAQGGKKPSDKDPLSWLYLNPQPVTDGTAFGVLRKSFGGRVNSAYEFGWRKAHVGPDFTEPDKADWTPNVERAEIVLPVKADDLLSDPETLLRQVDQYAAPNEAALLTYLTLPLQDCERIHVAFEMARSFAHRIAKERELATLVILHSPGAIGTAYPLHAHLLIVPRRISGLGLRHGPFDQPLIRDEGQEVLRELWEDHRSGGGKP